MRADVFRWFARGVALALGAALAVAVVYALVLGSWIAVLVFIAVLLAPPDELGDLVEHGAPTGS